MLPDCLEDQDSFPVLPSSLPSGLLPGLLAPGVGKWGRGGTGLGHEGSGLQGGTKAHKRPVGFLSTREVAGQFGGVRRKEIRDYRYVKREKRLLFSCDRTGPTGPYLGFSQSALMAGDTK